jgi:hypothetical protein
MIIINPNAAYRASKSAKRFWKPLLGVCKLKNRINRILKNFKRSPAFEIIKVIHCPNPRYILILLASLVVCGQVVVADVKPELLHLDCNMIESRSNNFSDSFGRMICVESSSSNIRGEGSAKIGDSSFSDSAFTGGQSGKIGNATTNDNTHQNEYSVNNGRRHFTHKQYLQSLIPATIFILIELLVFLIVYIRYKRMWW